MCFRSEDGSKTNAYAVTKVKIIGTQVIEIPFSALLEILPYEPKMTIDVKDWIDSDEMIASLKGSSYSGKYFDQHPDPEMFFIGLMVIPDNPKVENDQPYWFNSLLDDMMPLNCAMHAYTKEVNCGTVESVKYEYYPSEVKLYPNPAEDKISVEFPKEYIVSDAIANVFNPIGERILAKRVTGSLINFDVTGLAPGVYYLKIISGQKAVLKKFVVK